MFKNTSLLSIKLWDITVPSQNVDFHLEGRYLRPRDALRRPQRDRALPHLLHDVRHRCHKPSLSAMLTLRTCMSLFPSSFGVTPIGTDQTFFPSQSFSRQALLLFPPLHFVIRERASAREIITCESIELFVVHLRFRSENGIIRQGFRFAALFPQRLHFRVPTDCSIYALFILYVILIFSLGQSWSAIREMGCENAFFWHTFCCPE